MLKSLEVLFENDRFLVVSKPQNTPVQATRAGSISMLDLAEDYMTFKCGIEDPYVGLVHRLDQPTGGLMLLSKSPSATKALSEAFRNHRVEKKYLVLVQGHIVPESADVCHYLSADSKANYVTVSKNPAPGYQKAILHYRCLRHDTWQNQPVSLLEIHLDTGRQHQIRCQMSALGHGVIGDRKYGVVVANEPLMLWAFALTFSDQKRHYHFELPPTIEPMQSIYQAITG
ncbi:MAG: rRNA synthase [Clostridiales bacterium]|nr:rRNA synthase [Clostridiales bacterium]